ncbi:Uncharacterised protein [Porphyromonas macacae]|uniref:Uncharacterized protein n=1 Tax=Porphyromonas macacae TaxID=28115 RepID=A0A379DG34_9PORP|nr:Uncharacterised protein [Porphyromonas macacae]
MIKQLRLTTSKVTVREHSDFFYFKASIFPKKKYIEKKVTSPPLKTIIRMTVRGVRPN